MTNGGPNEQLVLGRSGGGFRRLLGSCATQHGAQWGAFEPPWHGPRDHHRKRCSLRCCRGRCGAWASRASLDHRPEKWDADTNGPLLMTMPGLGAVVGLTFRSAVDDPTRFSPSKKVGPWAGLTPSRNQSGERDVSGGKSRAGDANFRRALCQAATVMMNRWRSSWLRSWAAKVAKRVSAVLRPRP